MKYCSMEHSATKGTPVKTTRVDAAEKEASEVLHTLLSVERIEKIEIERDTSPNHSFQSNSTTDTVDSDTHIQWNTPVTITGHSIFLEDNSQFQQTSEDQPVVIWEGNVEEEHSETEINTIYTTTVDNIHPIQSKNASATTSITATTTTTPATKTTRAPKSNKPAVKKKKLMIKKEKIIIDHDVSENTKLEASSSEVKDRFKRGCECQDESCFRGLNSDSVYKHRLNIAELTKGEHDMYLMGVTMASLANPDTTVRHKERKRLRSQYVYQGRRVCLDAFLYLENCTHYQLKRIRKHVMTHGVAPRVHGNHGKKPHNTFSLDIYRLATTFLKQYLEQHTGESMTNSKQVIQLPWDTTRKNLHDAYKEYGELLEPGAKLMGYSTFRHFMKEQFPQVKFCKVEPKNLASATIDSLADVKTVNVVQDATRDQTASTQHIAKCVTISNDAVQQVIPLVVAPNDSGNPQHQQAFLVTPVPQILPNGNIVAQATTGTNAFSYQLTNTGYVINEHGNIVTSVTNAQTPYTFSRIQ